MTGHNYWSLDQGAPWLDADLYSETKIKVPSCTTFNAQRDASL